MNTPEEPKAQKDCSCKACEQIRRKEEYQKWIWETREERMREYEKNFHEKGWDM